MNWKDDPATEKQKTFLADLGVSFPANISKGDASRLIDEAKYHYHELPPAAPVPRESTGAEKINRFFTILIIGAIVAIVLYAWLTAR